MGTAAGAGQRKPVGLATRKGREGIEALRARQAITATVKSTGVSSMPVYSVSNFIREDWPQIDMKLRKKWKFSRMRPCVTWMDEHGYLWGVVCYSRVVQRWLKVSWTSLGKPGVNIFGDVHLFVPHTSCLAIYDVLVWSPHSGMLLKLRIMLRKYWPINCSASISDWWQALGSKTRIVLLLFRYMHGHLPALGPENVLFSTVGYPELMRSQWSNKRCVAM